MELTYGTNPHEPKTKPVSPLDLMGVLKRTQNQATKSFRFAPLLKRTQLAQVPPDTQEPLRRCGSAPAWGRSDQPLTRALTLSPAFKLRVSPRALHGVQVLKAEDSV